MAKPWAKLEQNYINHPKFLALDAVAICLWLEGKNYCDMHQTDGLIPREALKTFRFMNRRVITALTTSAGEKPNGELYAPLWEAKGLVGFKMHDYLDHNDCRDAVLARIEHADHEKAADRTRKAAARAVKKDRASTGRPPEVRPDKSHDSPGTVRRMSCSITETETETETTESKERSLTRQREREVTGNRAGRLREELYPLWYSKFRHGARLRLIANSLEYQEAVSLCATWDDDRIEKLAQIVLTTDDPYIAGTDRSFKIFALKASWADDRLKQAEAGV